MLKKIVILPVTIVLAALATALDGQTTRLVPSQYPTIQAAIDAATTGDIVKVASGWYLENLVIAGKEIRLSGQGPQVTTIDGSGAPLPVMRIGPGLGRALIVEQLAFTKGSGRTASGAGNSAEAGGIDVVGSTPTIRDCLFDENVGGQAAGGARGGGGAIRLADPGPDSGGALIRNCLFTGNLGGGDLLSPGVVNGGPGAILVHHAPAFIRASVFEDNFGADSQGDPASFMIVGIGAGAGAITIDPLGSQPVIEDCVFKRNTGGWSLADGPIGGAGAIGGGSPTIRYCVMRENQGGTAHSHGNPTAAGPGAILGDAPLVEGCIVIGNNGGNGLFDAGYAGAGGIQVTGDATILSSILAANTGGSLTVPYGIESGPGGILCDGGAVAITNCTLADNIGGAEIFIETTPIAGGIHCRLGTVTLLDCILWHDEDATGAIRELGGTTPTATFCDIEGGLPGTGNVAVDPLFVDPTLRNYHLAAGSPCIDSGSSAGASLPARDVDGELRVMGLEVDMGADEYGYGLAPGSSEDLRMTSRVNGAGNPECAAKAIGAGDLLELRLFSPGGSLVPSSFALVASARPNFAPPLVLPLLPGCHVDPLDFMVLAPSSLALLNAPVANGLLWVFPVAASHPGWSLWVQGLALSPGAANGCFALSEAHELRFR